jgi:RNase P subunit RPR2
MSSRKKRRERERQVEKAFKKSNAEQDTKLVQSLMNITGLDEVTASNLIGEQDCRFCNYRLIPISVLTNDQDDWAVDYMCLRCNQTSMYHIKTKQWTKMQPIEQEPPKKQAHGEKA